MTMNNNQSIIANTEDTEFVSVLEDIIAQLRAGTIDNDKAARMVLSESYAQRIDSCYVCHKTIEAGEETAHKRIDPVTDQMPTSKVTMDDGSYVAYRYRHGYHPSFTNTDLGFHLEEDNRLRDKFRK
jgi:hypothetical protein